MANKKRLIDANAVDYENIACSQLQLEWLNRIIEKQPTVNAVEVVHGRWIRYLHGSGIYCSECKHKRRYKDEHDNYCPSCGAKMDGEAINEA